MMNTATRQDGGSPPEDASARQTTTATLRLTAAQAIVRYLAAQSVVIDDDKGHAQTVPLFGGVFAIFGHGNVAAMGEALYQHREVLPTYRAHNEQAMAHSAIGYAKTYFRRRMMAVTTSIGPGATNLVTAAALAHVNRLPVLLLPGDIFVSRAPDPVLQQLEDFQDGGVSANDALKPVSRYFDRIVHPAQLLTALPRALRVLTDAALCGPVTLALPQDVQAMAFDFPAEFFAPRIVTFAAPMPSPDELDAALARLQRASRPMIVAGGGVLYSRGAAQALRQFAERHGVPVGETQAGKGALPWDHPLNVGAVGVTGASAANSLAHEADCVLAVGTRLQDFTTGSNTLFTQADVVCVNANRFDAIKHLALSVVADARAALDALGERLVDWYASDAWAERARTLAVDWRETVRRRTHAEPQAGKLPYEADVIGAVQRSAARSPEDDIVVCAAGTCPASFISSGARAALGPITSNTATRAWAMRSRAALARSLPGPIAR
jgi:3D-(3,5/4)-trihydroxycyclohexane-1,2-dione acylhydrolase (decyclizing)